MTAAKTTEKLTLKQVLVRMCSVVACWVGIGACVYSLSLQLQDVGSLIASACWFSGLGCTVTGIAGYVVTCSPRHRNFVSVAVVCALVGGVVLFWVARRYLGVGAVVGVSVGMLAVQGVVLIAYHHLLKREDPMAL